MSFTHPFKWFDMDNGWRLLVVPHMGDGPEALRVAARKVVLVVDTGSFEGNVSVARRMLDDEETATGLVCIS